MIDATRSGTDQEIINAYWRGYNDACKKMENIKELELTTICNIAEKTLGFEMEPVKAEDIPNFIASILEKVAKRKVKVEGNGLTEDIKMEFLGMLDKEIYDNYIATQRDFLFNALDYFKSC